ncbi:thiosulfate oxidation carrier complex protein SoxZ [uncultured Sphaerotilus sp.]|uniref:thiosulfate oxidation carrier complex protein SoxZ n=1 Tax=uncultured Sphaerotilus sp. TaxID=474984 RepID=UPI0030CA18AA
MADPIRIRAQLKDNTADVRTLVSHPMETGVRKDNAGQLVPAHYITNYEASLNGRVVLSGKWGVAVSQNPFVWFRLTDCKAGDKVSVRWLDNKGDTRTDEIVLA